MWCICHLKHALTLFFIDKMSRGAFKTWNSLCSGGLTVRYPDTSKLLSGTASLSLARFSIKERRENHCREKQLCVCVRVCVYVCVCMPRLCVSSKAEKTKSTVALLCMCLGVLSCVHVALKFVLQKSTYVIDFAVRPHKEWARARAQTHKQTQTYSVLYLIVISLYIRQAGCQAACSVWSII